MEPYKSCQELAEELNVLKILNILKIDEALIEHIRERGELVKTFTKEREKIFFFSPIKKSIN